MRSFIEQISLEKDYEVRHWMRTLRWTQDELYTAVRQVGRGVVDLQRLRASMPAVDGSVMPVGAYGMR